MAILGFELEEIARLLALLEANDLDAIEIQEGDRYLRIRSSRRKSSVPLGEQTEFPPALRSLPAAGRNALRPAEARIRPDTLPADQIALVSPMMGVFYRSDKPGTPPLVDVGERVSVGQTIGIIEAMKVFSEIPAEHSGTVLAVLGEDGQLVQTGEALVILRKDA